MLRRWLMNVCDYLGSLFHWLGYLLDKEYPNADDM